MFSAPVKQRQKSKVKTLLSTTSTLLARRDRIPTLSLHQRIIYDHNYIFDRFLRYKPLSSPTFHHGTVSIQHYIYSGIFNLCRFQKGMPGIQCFARTPSWPQSSSQIFIQLNFGGACSLVSSQSRIQFLRWSDLTDVHGHRISIKSRDLLNKILFYCVNCS